MLAKLLFKVVLFLHAGAGMNAAFATGRLCDLQTGRVRLLNHKNSSLMVRAIFLK
jgi:hypothetical protein